MIEKIYLDMDGVLVDFETRYHSLFGSDAEKNTQNWVPNWKHWVGTQQFRSLEWEQNGKILFRFIRRLGIPYEILSSSGGHMFYDEIKEQKIDWLQNNGFDCPINIVPGKKYKQDYAKSGYLIIDDTSSIIEQWRAKGGFAILHDCNRLADTLEQIKQYMYEDAA